MKRKLWPPNRVYLGMAVILVLLGFWEFSWKPQYRDYYKLGMKEYQAGNFEGALPLLSHAYKISPNALEVITMMGWTHLRLHQYREARSHFTRALKFDPSSDE